MSRGVLIHVAHWERSPIDLANLSVEGRFTANPGIPYKVVKMQNNLSNGKHGQFTAGMIENQEPGKRHGFAPDYKLYDLELLCS